MTFEIICIYFGGSVGPRRHRGNAAWRERGEYDVASSEAEKPERSPLVILFAEMRGFTGMSDMLDPAIVLARVGEFVSLMAKAVEAHEGAVVDILSDTVMATFTGQDDAQHAVAAAQEIQAGFAALAEAWQRDFGIRAAVSQGLHCGDAVIGFAKGSPTPEQLFVFGDCVSIANRLLHRARAGEFVLSETLMDLAAEMGVAIEAEELPALEIPRRDPIKLFGVLVDTRLDFTRE
jgi:adenylate cyclase